jgi:hypothetical protein
MHFHPRGGAQVRGNARPRSDAQSCDVTTVESGPTLRSPDRKAMDQLCLAATLVTVRWPVTTQPRGRGARDNGGRADLGGGGVRHRGGSSFNREESLEPRPDPERRGVYRVGAKEVEIQSRRPTKVVGIRVAYLRRPRELGPASGLGGVEL